MLRRFSTKKNKEDTETRERRRILNKFLEFLSSSIWSIPIASFIEQQSIVFDRQQMETDVYETIHKEFSMLIDTLIECFCDDMNIPTEKLGESLKFLDQENLSMKQRISLEPLAAAQNFNVFVPMMMRKNIELQIQALQMIEFMCGLIPNVLQLEDGETLVNLKKLSPEDTERYVLISVLRQSKEEFESLKQVGQEEVQTMAVGSEQQILRLEQEILKEEFILQRALTDGMTHTSSSGVQTMDTPLSIAAIMISQMANSSTNTDGAQSSSSGTMTDSKKETRDSETNTDKEKAKLAMLTTTDSQTESSTGAIQTQTGTTEDPNVISNRPTTEKKNQGTDSSETADGVRPKTAKKDQLTRANSSTETDEKRPKTAKKEQTAVSSETERPKTSKKELLSSSSDGGVLRPKTGKREQVTSSTETDGDRPRTGKKNQSNTSSEPNEIASKSVARRPSTGRPPTASKKATKETTTDSGSQVEIQDKKSFSTSETNTDEIDNQKQAKTRPKSAKRVGTSSTRRSSAVENKTEEADAKSSIRPTSRHTSRRESLDRTKTEDRPSTRRSSIDKSAPKRNDSIPSDRRGSSSRNGDQKESDDKTSTSKRPGPVREPRYPQPGSQQEERAESPGADHGPRRRNLGDVHSHLVDRDRLNSSDVRARAEYLRQQRDILLRMKREERIKHMNEATKDSTERPKTAKVARGMLEKAENENIRKEIHQKIQTQILTL